MLYELLPELAMKETRSITLFPRNPYGLPPGNYGLVEQYCNEEGCDCRRVLLNVMSDVTMGSVAVIAYGWESMDFYAKWFGIKKMDIKQMDELEKDSVKKFKGPCLNLFSSQSEFAPAVMQMVIDCVLKDEKYVDRLKRHYMLFRAIIDEKHRGAKSEEGKAEEFGRESAVMQRNAPPDSPYYDPSMPRAAKVGRNEPCPCGCGKKYKKCCGA